MQDRFKFRAWYKPDNYIINIPVDCFGAVFNCENFIVMQCTGLKDKNGKLIYENDIVKFYFDNDEIIGVIAWSSDNQIGFYVDTTDYFKDKYITDYDFLSGEKYEIIGNIYENPELLEV